MRTFANELPESGSKVVVLGPRVLSPCFCDVQSCSEGGTLVFPIGNNSLSDKNGFYPGGLLVERNERSEYYWWHKHESTQISAADIMGVLEK